MACIAQRIWSSYALNTITNKSVRRKVNQPFKTFYSFEKSIKRYLDKLRYRWANTHNELKIRCDNYNSNSTNGIQIIVICRFYIRF